MCVAFLAAATSTASVAPADAVTMPNVEAQQLSDVQQAQYHRPRRGWDNHRPGWYNGHRGYRNYQRGYRRHSDGFWYLLAAFGAGALIGGAVASQSRTYSGGSAHVQWCSERYRTYRASDNTYVPRLGVRAQCNSPYN